MLSMYSSNNRQKIRIKTLNTKQQKVNKVKLINNLPMNLNKNRLKNKTKSKCVRVRYSYKT